MRIACEKRDQDLLFLVHGMLSFGRAALMKLHLRRCEECGARKAEFHKTARALRVAFGGPQLLVLPRPVFHMWPALALGLLLAAVGFGAFAYLLSDRSDAAGSLDHRAALPPEIGIADCNPPGKQKLIEQALKKARGSTYGPLDKGNRFPDRTPEGD